VITILVVGASGAEPSSFAQSHPSVEILTAADADDALEKLARNRRIDAVLLMPGAAAVEAAETLREEDPAAPPIFAPAAVGSAPGVRRLSATTLEELLELLVRALSADG
jgi:CheY-like chemotaxis protein